jgi:hypothetical protein
LGRLFINIEDQWVNSGSNPAQVPEILSYKLTSSEWLIITSLKRILQQFAMATDQLQADSATGQDKSSLGRFDEYLPVVEFLLDHLETAITGWIIDFSRESPY